MTYTVEYNANTKIIESHFQGETDLEELKEVARKTLQIVQQTNCLNVLTDLSDASLNASVVDLFEHPQQLAEIIQEAGLNVHMLKRAFVARGEGESFKFYEDVAVNRGHTVMLFHDLDKARNWLQGK